MTQKEEDIFIDGVYTLPKQHKVKIKKMMKYCTEKNIKPENLTQEEMKMFLEKLTNKP